MMDKTPINKSIFNVELRKSSPQQKAAQSRLGQSQS